MTLPSLLVGTDDDLATPVSRLRQLERRLPRAYYQELPSGRHLALVERHRQEAQLLSSWHEERADVA